jgi:predicted nucleotidyltransferase
MGKEVWYMPEILEGLVCKNSYGTFQVSDILMDFNGKIPPEYKDAILSMTLFGSYARNEQTEESDMDICVIYDKAKMVSSKMSLLLGGISFDLLGIYGVDLQPLCFTSEYYGEHKNSSPLFLNIQKEGIRLC